LEEAVGIGGAGAVNATCCQTYLAVLGPELLDDGGWSSEVRAAARREVFLIGAAAYWRYDDVEALDAHQAHTLAKKEKIEPTALNDEAAC
jgi:hypothetical protein